MPPHPCFPTSPSDEKSASISRAAIDIKHPPPPTSTPQVLSQTDAQRKEMRKVLASFPLSPISPIPKKQAAAAAGLDPAVVERLAKTINSSFSFSPRK